MTQSHKSQLAWADSQLVLLCSDEGLPFFRDRADEARTEHDVAFGGNYLAADVLCVFREVLP